MLNTPELRDMLDNLVADPPAAPSDDLDTMIARGRRAATRRAVARTALAVVGVAGLSVALATSGLVRGSPRSVPPPQHAPAATPEVTPAANPLEVRFGAAVDAVLPPAGRTGATVVRAHAASGGQVTRDYEAYALYADGARRGSVSVRVFDTRGPEGTFEVDRAYTCEPVMFPAPECTAPVQLPGGVLRTQNLPLANGERMTAASLLRPDGTVVDAISLTMVDEKVFRGIGSPPSLLAPALTVDQLVRIVTDPSLALPT